MTTRRKHIENQVDDMIAKLLYYDRKEDGELEVGDIEEAIKEGEISVDEIVQRFSEGFRKAVS